MQKTLRVLKAVLVVLLCAACAVFALFLIVSPVFKEGESYEVYYGRSSSSLSKRTEDPLAEKLAGGVYGECVRYHGDRYLQLKQQFSAEELFTERVGEVVNHYLYSPYLGRGVRIDGYLVNLHIAVSEEQTAAGTPLIFGGI